jgi:hypothetical protein
MTLFMNGSRPPTAYYDYQDRIEKMMDKDKEIHDEE